MDYQQALQLWGAAQIEGQSFGRRKKKIDPATVTVVMDFNEGFACCGGTDPGCHCSFGESPSAKVKITGKEPGGMLIRSAEIDAADFDFAKVLAEIIAAGDGTLTLENLSLPSSSYDG